MLTNILRTGCGLKVHCSTDGPCGTVRASSVTRDDRPWTRLTDRAPGSRIARALTTWWAIGALLGRDQRRWSACRGTFGCAHQ